MVPKRNTLCRRLQTVLKSASAVKNSGRQLREGCGAQNGTSTTASIRPQKMAQSKQRQTTWVLKLEDFIRRRFGPTKDAVAQASDRVGDVAVVLMRLSKPVPAGEQQVVQFGRLGGDNNFDVVEGERFVADRSELEQAVRRRRASGCQATAAVGGNVRSPLGQFTARVVGDVFRRSWGIPGVLHLPLLRIASFGRGHRRHGNGESLGHRLLGFLVPFVEFFRKPRILAILAFLLLYRFPEAQLVKLTTPFLLDSREVGGLALTTSEVGVVYGTVGVAMLTLGGLIGGFVVARGGLGRCLWPMALAIHLPNLAFLFLAYAQPESRWVITAAVAVEQFGYGFGFTAYMLYCVYVATGKHQTVHYALCTGCMALGMMIPGMWSGWLQELIGYQHFFVWIMLAMIPSLLAVSLIPVDPEFGKKRAA